MAMTDELLIGTSEASEILGVSRSTVQRWADNGDLPFVRKLPNRTGAFLFSAGVVRRLAQKRLVAQAERRAS